MAAALRSKRARWLSLAGLFAALVGATWLLGPGSEGQAGAQVVNECGVNVPYFLADPQPEAPLEMNTVVIGSLIKTVVMEKDVFECHAGRETPSTVKDLETFIEIVETDEGDVVEKRVEVAECVKNFVGDEQKGGSVTCSVEDLGVLPEPAGNAPGPIGGCVQRAGDQPADPVVMNTVAARKLVKTIKVEKEFMRCPGGIDQIGHVYLFTEIIETPVKLASGTWTVRPVAKRFEGIICLISEREAEVISCRQFPTS